MTKPANVTQGELERVWKAARNARVPMVETLIEPDGTIRIMHSETRTDNADQALEEWLAAS